MDCLDSVIPMFSRGANLSSSEMTKVAVRNGMNGEFTRINCEKLRSEFTKERDAKARADRQPSQTAYATRQYTARKSCSNQ